MVERSVPTATAIEVLTLRKRVFGGHSAARSRNQISVGIGQSSGPYAQPRSGTRLTRARGARAKAKSRISWNADDMLLFAGVSS